MVSVRFEGPYFITSFDDGSELVADTREQPGQKETADLLGMSVREMNETHDLFHSCVADAIGLRCSPSLWNAANNRGPSELAGLEEEAIMAVQKFWAAAAREGWKKR